MKIFGRIKKLKKQIEKLRKQIGKDLATLIYIIKEVPMANVLAGAHPLIKEMESIKKRWITA